MIDQNYYLVMIKLRKKKLIYNYLIFWSENWLTGRVPKLNFSLNFLKFNLKNYYLV